MIILYGLLTAYFTGGEKIIASLIGWESKPLLLMSCIDLSFLQRINTLLMLLLVFSFGVLAFMGAGHLQTQRLSYTDWLFLPLTLPIIVTAFHFHNIIPTLSADLNWDMALFRKAVFWGMLLALVMNGLWVFIRMTGENSILESFHTNAPATLPMAFQIKSGLFTLCASIFALVAICTSFLANAVGLQSFIRDLLANVFRIESRPLVIAVTFLPPLLTALIYPDIFLKALDIVGGVGIVVLFGVLPTLIVMMDRTRSPKLRLVCLAAFLFSLAILGLEILQETNLLQLKPWVEYHSVNF